MGPCCVEGCEITSEETFYFEFPTSRTLRRKWLELIPIPGKLLLGTVVCSRHFSSTDYENIRGKVRLKSKVVPSLLLDQKKTPPNESPSNQPKSATSTQEEDHKSSSPETEQARSPAEQAESPTDQARSPKECSRSPSNRPKSPKERSRSPSNRPKSPKERSRSPLKPARSSSEVQKARSPSPLKPDTCNSPRLTIPSPVDAEKMIDELQKEAMTSKAKVVTSKAKKRNGVSNQCIPPVVQSAPPDPPLDQKEDIEDMITNYHIKNKVPNPALLADLVPLPPDPSYPDQNPETIEIEDIKEAEPVFIELSVNKDGTTTTGGNGDCLMVLESVQVDVDPSTLLLAQDDDYYRDEEDPKSDRKEDPISLLTSSDEDDVILQEPHIDTVEVSDETDEDDKPLVTLVKNKPVKKIKVLKKKSKDKRSRFMWTCDFYCVQCQYTTNNSAEYNKHLSTHSTVLQVCSICSYTSASKSNFARHKRNHKVEKKFKCHLCEYKARHKMSLIYHLKSHNHEEMSSPANLAKFSCKNCCFKSSDKDKILQHLQSCDGITRYSCGNCDYFTKKRSDLKRHRARKHPELCDYDDDDDMEYIPTNA